MVDLIKKPERCHHIDSKVSNAFGAHTLRHGESGQSSDTIRWCIEFGEFLLMFMWHTFCMEQAAYCTSTKTKAVRCTMLLSPSIHLKGKTKMAKLRYQCQSGTIRSQTRTDNISKTHLPCFHYSIPVLTYYLMFDNLSTNKTTWPKSTISSPSSSSLFY